MHDPVDALAHDHGHLSALLVELRTTLTRVDKGDAAFEECVPELEHAAEVLRDAMIEHFAREEEALFPFVEERLPSLREKAASVRADHDPVCARSARLCGTFRRAANVGHDVSFVSAELSRLEVVYATHSYAEIQFLEEVRVALDPEGRDILRALLAAI